MADLAKIVEDLSSLTVLEAVSFQASRRKVGLFRRCSEALLLPVALLALLLRLKKKRPSSTSS